MDAPHSTAAEAALTLGVILQLALLRKHLLAGAVIGALTKPPVAVIGALTKPPSIEGLVSSIEA